MRSSLMDVARMARAERIYCTVSGCFSAGAAACTSAIALAMVAGACAAISG